MQSDDDFMREVLLRASVQITRFPPDGASACEVRLEKQDLVFECEHPRFSHGRVAYRIEALPEDEVDRQSSIGWAGIAVANWREAVEAADAPPPGPPDEHGVRWLPD